ncbi:MAG: TolC family protein [Chthoniobacteraceae bacterium]
MKPIPFFLCTLSVLLTARAEPPEKPGDSPSSTLSLSDVTDSVLTNNPAIQEARAKWEAMNQRVPQAAAWDDLRVSANTRLGRFVPMQPNGMVDQMLSVEQMLPLSGRNQSRARIAAAEALGSLEAVRRKELDVVARARAAYFRLAKGYALLELLRANTSSLHQTLDITRAKLEVADQSQADVLTAENEVTRIEETRRDLLRGVSDDETQLKVLMNRDPFSPLGRPAASVAHAALPQVARLRSLMFSNRPEVRMAEAGVTAAKAKLELAKREWIPDPTLSVGVQRYNAAAQAVSELNAGVSFNLPWFNGKKYRAGENEAQRGVEAAQRALDAARTEALGLLRDQLRKIETLHHHLDLFGGRLIPTARQIVQTNRTNYEGGKTGFLELVTSDRALRDVEAMQRQHLADYEAAIAELEALVGADLHPFSTHKETTKRKSK